MKKLTLFIENYLLLIIFIMKKEVVTNFNINFRFNYHIIAIIHIFHYNSDFIDLNLLIFIIKIAIIANFISQTSLNSFIMLILTTKFKEPNYYSHHYTINIKVIVNSFVINFRNEHEDFYNTLKMMN